MDAAHAQHDTIYQYVQGVLNNTSRTARSSITVAGVIVAVCSVFDEACADYAEVWNRQHSRVGVAGHIAPEILTNCFRFTDFASLVQATHVCRRWRDLALADRAPWASFRFGSDQDGKKGMNKAIQQLSAMLDRSRPVPFVLQLPCSASSSSAKARLISILQDDIWRLRTYNGPRNLFLHLNKDGVHMPHIFHIQFLGESVKANAWSEYVFEFPVDWGTRGAPNLRRLETSLISVPTACNPLHALQYLTFNVAGPCAAYRQLFRCCPSLVKLELVCVESHTMLPAGPLPPSLSDVALYAPDGIKVEFSTLLALWSGQSIPRLTIHSERDLSTALERFASSFQGPIGISMTSNRVAISLSSASAGQNTGSQPKHIVYPFSWREINQLLALRGPCGSRLTSINIRGDRFADFFATRIRKLRFALKRYKRTLER